MLDVHEIGPHYAETLQRWCANVHEHIDEICARGYDRTFEPASSIDAIGMVAKKANSSSVVILSVVDQSSGW